MLNSISINGYRKLNNLCLDNLKKFNLIVGPNNTGKSSILEATFTHCAPLNFRILLAILTIRSGGFNFQPVFLFEQIGCLFNLTNKNERKIIISSKQADRERETTITMHGDSSVTSIPEEINVEISAAPVKNQENMGNIGFTVGRIGMSFKATSQKKIEDSIVISYGQPLRIGMPKIKTDLTAVFSDSFQHRRLDSGIEEYSNAIRKGCREKILKMMQMLDAEINELVILVGEDKQPHIYVDYGRSGIMPLNNLGDGLRRIFQITGQILKCSNGIFLIDELESSIHQKALGVFVRWLVKVCEDNNIQLFATTHSLECIDAVLDCESIRMDDLSLYKLGQQDDSVHVQRIAGGDLKEIRYELGHDIRG
jgi:AAA15 family ATPase/GTPase